MIMTPNISCISLTKQKITQHPNWQPYAFENLDLKVLPEAEAKNDYATFRKWLIKKEIEYVEQ